MAWQLEIHHLDVRDVGDSTIIRVVDTVTPANNRLILVDGGTAGATARVHNYITTNFPGAQVNVIVATHYDRDHYEGISGLLNLPLAVPANIYDNAILYDPGNPANNSLYYEKSTGPGGGGGAKKAKKTHDTNYIKYLRAIRNKPTIRRATQLVNSFQIVSYDAGWNQLDPGILPIPGPIGVNNSNYYRQSVIGQNALAPYWLLGKDIMWGNGGDGVAPVAIAGGPVPGPALAWDDTQLPAAGGPVPANAPKMRCIAANKWTLQPAPANRTFISDAIVRGRTLAQINNLENGFNRQGLTVLNRNQSSLAFILEFGHFRYYIGGDLEMPQEDGYVNLNLLAPPPRPPIPGVRHYVNQTNNMAGRVLVIRTSHHGSVSATSRDFVTHLRPSAAIISNGRANVHDHPAQSVINVLDGYKELPVNADTGAANKHPDNPPSPPFKPVTHYLTGFNHPVAPVFNDKTYGGTESFTAGHPTNLAGPFGNIKFLISEAESLRQVEGFLYRAILNTVNIMTANLAVPGINAVNIANAGATYGAFAAVADIVGASYNAAMKAMEAAAYIGNGYNNTDDDSLCDRAVNAMTTAAAVLAVNAVAPLVGLGIGEAVGNAARNKSKVQIEAAVNLVVGASPNAAQAAAIAASIILGHNRSETSAGYAAAAAVGAVNIQAALPAGGIAANSLQAVALGATIGAESDFDFVDEMVATIYDSMVHVDIGGGANINLAALIAAVATVCASKGEAVSMSEAIEQALIRAGIANATATAQATIAVNATNLAGGNDLFRVSFHDYNPAYLQPGVMNPRTIAHKS